MTARIVRPWEEVGISYRQFDHWVCRGYLPGVGQPGSGNYRSLTAEQFERLATMARLVDIGMTPEGANDMLNQGRAERVLAAATS